MFKKLRILIIGCGLIGNKRAENLDNKKVNLVFCCDVNEKVGKNFASKFNCKYISNYKKINLKSIDVVFVCVTHNKLKEISSYFIKNKKHVFIEKPGSLNLKEIKNLRNLEMKYKNIVIGIGLNHRFHPGFIEAFQIVKRGGIGKLMFIRAQYGHGGRIGYDKEWRSKPNLSGGGELIDQGTHLIDLSQCFLGDLKLINGDLRTYFWNMKVEDNCFLTLENKKKNIAFLQASCSEWKNTFNFEIYGETGKLQIIGLGGSYGIETIKFYKMRKQLGPPDTKIIEYPKKDISWKLEQNNFFDIINKKSKKKKFASLEQMVKIHKITKEIYKKNDY